MDRAIGLTAGLYIVVLIAAVPVGNIFFSNSPNGAGPGLASASPFWGVGFSSAMFGGNAGPGHAIGRHAALAGAGRIPRGMELHNQAEPQDSVRILFLSGS